MVHTRGFPGGSDVGAAGTIGAYRHLLVPERPALTLVPASNVRHASGVADLPLNADEERVWRSLMRLVFTLRPALDEDLQQTCGLSSTEYSVLMHLSESPDRQLRMSDLADRTSLSPSRISRVIDGMARAGLVERRPGSGSGSGDGRNTFAAATRTGLSTLRRAWPHHLRSVRKRAFDHLTAEETRSLGAMLQRLAEAGDASRTANTGESPAGRKRS
jgi:DNA-binding MarR family transcriptional regulator